MWCEVCGNSNIRPAMMEVMRVVTEDETVRIGWGCDDCGSTYWADCAMGRVVCDYVGEPSPTVWTHPSLSAAERNPGLAGGR